MFQFFKELMENSRESLALQRQTAKQYAEFQRQFADHERRISALEAAAAKRTRKGAAE